MRDGGFSCEIIVRMARRASMAVGVLLVWCGIASALNPSLEINQYAHKAWTIRDGFFKAVTYSITQTPDGYLWLGTETGLLRFDGVRYIPWQPPAGQSLPSSFIYSLLAARDGRLWIGTDKGLASWKDGKLTHYPELAGDFAFSLLEDSDGALWAGTGDLKEGRLCAIRNGGEQCYGQDGSLGRGVYSLYEENGHLWASTDTGVWQWKPGPPKLYPMMVVGRDFRQDLNDDHGRLLISVQGEIRQLANGRVERYPMSPTGAPFESKQLLRDRDGSLWIGTRDQGLLHLHQGKTDRFTRSDGLSGDAVYGLFQDREGNIWVATAEGLDRFRDFALPTITVKQGLSSEAPGSVQAGRDGSVWLDAGSVLNRWNNGRITVYGNENGLPGNPQSLFEEDRRRIWAATRQGIAYFEGGRFVPATSLPKGEVHSIAEDSDGNMSFAYDDSLVQLLKAGSVQQTAWPQLGRKEFASVQIPDPGQGGIWLGFRFDGGVAHLREGHVRESYTATNGLGKGLVAGLQLDRDGTLWAATEGGLSRIKDGHVATLTSRNGLPCDAVHWMKEDDDHSVWLYMSCGLVRIAKSELDGWAADPKRIVQTTTFDSSDGVRLRATAVTGYTPRVSKAVDGKLWFLVGDGVSVLDPRHLPSPVPPPVQIEQITADHRTYWDNSVDSQPSNLRLPPRVRDLEIDYTALSLAAPETTRFKYKLEGHDPDWKDMGSDRKAFYNDLPPRNYRFRVMASNNSGVWNEAGASFDFSVAPAYYQTAWFQTLCALAGLALLWGLYRYRLHQIAREFNVRMEERVGERTRLARDLHDTLLQGFQGLMLRLQALDELLPQGEAKDELEQTLNRADQVVAEGRRAVHDLRLSTVVTNDLARAVKALGDELSSEDSATFELLVEGERRELHPIIRDEVYRITREALRNAFSHARARHIEAEITYGEQLFRLRTRDDGEGIAPAILEDGRPGHYGLPGMRERAAEIGAKLDIWSGVGTGTEIDLSIAGSIAYGKRAGRSRLRVFPEKAE